MNAQQAINELKQTIEVPPAMETAWKEVWNAKFGAKSRGETREFDSPNGRGRKCLKIWTGESWFLI